MEPSKDFLLKETIKAIDIVLKEFKGKTDKGGRPYFEHLAFVQSRMDLNDYQSMTVALLHDLLEDCPQWDEIRLRENGFSERTIQALVAITKIPHEPYTDYIQRVSKNPIAVKVKLADLEHNMDIRRLPTLGKSDYNRLKKYHWAYGTLKGKFESKTF